MAAGYKVRLGDGSEIGPMDLDAVKSWYTQGLIQKDSPVLKPGSSRWNRLAEVIPVGGSGRSASGAPTRYRTTSTRMAPQRSAPEWVTSSWPQKVAGGLFLVAALAACFFYFEPNSWIASLEGAPFREIALVFAAFGLCLLPGWETARKVVRICLLVLLFALLPVAGAVFASGVRGAALGLLASAFVMLLGFFLLTAREPETWLSIVALLVLVAGGVGVASFGWVKEGLEEARVRTFATSDRRFTDPAAEVSIELPRGWVVLRKEEPFVKVPPEARLVLADPRRGGFAYLTVESAPLGAQGLDPLLDRFLQARRLSFPGLKEVSRSDVLVGHIPGRASEGTWETAGVRYADTSLVWRDGWVSVAFAAYLPEAEASSGSVESLVKAIASPGELSARLQGALVAATQAIPHLTPQSVELLMSRSAAQVLEPQEVFRRSYEWTSRGLPSLSPKEARELGDLNFQAFSSLAPRDRTRLGAYIERVRGQKPTTPDEDRTMAGLMRTGVLRLPEARIARLQSLYEKAILAAAEVGAR
jgi:hypothetical protein